MWNHLKPVKSKPASLYLSLAATLDRLHPPMKATIEKTTGLRRLRLRPQVLGDLDTSSTWLRRRPPPCDLHHIQLYSTTLTQYTPVTMATPCLHLKVLIYCPIPIILAQNQLWSEETLLLKCTMQSLKNWLWVVLVSFRYSEAVQPCRLQKEQSMTFSPPTHQ